MSSGACHLSVPSEEHKDLSILKRKKREEIKRGRRTGMGDTTDSIHFRLDLALSEVGDDATKLVIDQDVGSLHPRHTRIARVASGIFLDARGIRIFFLKALFTHTSKFAADILYFRLAQSQW